MEYSEGTQTVYHEDGSTTYISVEHVPPTEPMSRAAVILWTTVSVVGTSLAVGSPLILVAWEERRAKKRDLKERQKKNQEIYSQLNPS